jgi:hypothetical protein
MATQEMAEIRSTFGVSEAELAGLRVRSSEADLLDLARTLRRRVIASRIPGIVRTPDEWLGGRTILQVLLDDGTASVYAYLEHLSVYGAP